MNGKIWKCASANMESSQNLLRSLKTEIWIMCTQLLNSSKRSLFLSHFYYSWARGNPSQRKIALSFYISLFFSVKWIFCIICNSRSWSPSDVFFALSSFTGSQYADTRLEENEWIHKRQRKWSVYKKKTNCFSWCSCSKCWKWIRSNDENQWTGHKMAYP